MDSPDELASPLISEIAKVRKDLDSGADELNEVLLLIEQQLQEANVRVSIWLPNFPITLSSESKSMTLEPLPDTRITIGYHRFERGKGKDRTRKWALAFMDHEEPVPWELISAPRTVRARAAPFLIELLNLILEEMQVTRGELYDAVNAASPIVAHQPTKVKEGRNLSQVFRLVDGQIALARLPLSSHLVDRIQEDDYVLPLLLLYGSEILLKEKDVGAGKLSVSMRPFFLERDPRGPDGPDDPRDDPYWVTALRLLTLTSYVPSTLLSEAFRHELVEFRFGEEGRYIGGLTTLTNDERARVEEPGLAEFCRRWKLTERGRQKAKEIIEQHLRDMESMERSS